VRVRYNRGAASDLSEILDYLSRHSPVAASNQLDKFENTTRLIGKFPFIGKETKRPNLRQVVVGDYLMVYEVGADVVTIHYVRHGSRKRPWQTE
jgi:toxin ParE1/3/4